ncbi:Hypothetical protein Ccan_10630 [Capnocytophaga canimorsus Cc5]|uniref:Uncharacterized protein n=1 Tax=Capnocytophaga canimorsus (strain 5) TaxID=860228 RepID=F9YVD4_CAPCC|nr:Hypothetical protein Ccan_10630 [Capnocytophaga canimorsus Cc5]
MYTILYTFFVLKLFQLANKLNQLLLNEFSVVLAYYAV